MAYIGPYQVYTIDGVATVARVQDWNKHGVSINTGFATVKGEAVAEAKAYADAADAAAVTSANQYTDASEAEAIATAHSYTDAREVAAVNAAKTYTDGKAFLPAWKPLTAYIANEKVVAPNGDVVSAKVAFTSTGTYNAANWNASSQDGRLATLETQKWRRGDIGTATDFNTLTTPGNYGILFSSGVNQPAPFVQTLDVKAFGTGLVQEAITWEQVPRPLLRNNSGGIWRQWHEFRLEDPALFEWRSAYRLCTTAPAQILVIGDSNTEGTGATTVAGRWQTILQEYLRRQVGNQTGALFPFIPGRYAATTAGLPVASTGVSPVGGFGWGLGWRTVSIRDDSTDLTFTFTGTSAKLMYLKTTTTGKAIISVDGGADVLLDTNGPTDNAAVWSTGALTQGVHTVRVRRDSTSAAGQWVYVEGLLTYNTDETKGIRVVDAAKHGITSGQLTQGNSDNTAAAVKAAGPFAAAIITLGTNDYSAGTAPLAYRDNILRQIAALRGSLGGFNGSIILVNMPMGSGRDDALWAPYGAQLAIIAAADPKVKYLDMRWDMPDIPTPSTDPAGEGNYSDMLHLGPKGHREFAGKLAKVLHGR